MRIDKNMRIIKYDIKKYNFVSLVEAVFSGIKLNELYRVSPEYRDVFEVGKDSSTVFHTMFYDAYRKGWKAFEDMYFELISKVISPLYDESFLYQSFPTVRFHIPDNVAVGAFHTDAEFGHPSGEMNYILPLTNSSNTSSVWVESAPGKLDFSPIDMFIGEIIEFNGNQLTHGNKINRTSFTRVSIDFRILPISKYDDTNNLSSITQKTKFKLGQYYKLYEQKETRLL